MTRTWNERLSCIQTQQYADGLSFACNPLRNWKLRTIEAGEISMCDGTEQTDSFQILGGSRQLFPMVTEFVSPSAVVRPTGDDHRDAEQSTAEFPLAGASTAGTSDRDAEEGRWGELIGKRLSHY